LHPTPSLSAQELRFIRKHASGAGFWDNRTGFFYSQQIEFSSYVLAISISEYSVVAEPPCSNNGMYTLNVAPCSSPAL